MTDYVDTLLGFIADNWQTANYEPKPTLIDGRDTRRHDTGERDVTADLADNNVVTVAPADEDREPEGVGYSHDAVEATSTVRIEGAHESEYGHIADGDEFGRLVDEVARTLRVERIRPLPNIYRLEVRGADAQSQSYQDYYRTDLPIAFVGIDDLP